jgi:hypothetical protein
MDRHTLKLSFQETEEKYLINILTKFLFSHRAF